MYGFYSSNYILKKQVPHPFVYIIIIYQLSSENINSFAHNFSYYFMRVYLEKEIVIIPLYVYNNNWGRSPSLYARYNNKTKAIEENKKKQFLHKTQRNEYKTKHTQNEKACLSVSCKIFPLR